MGHWCVVMLLKGEDGYGGLDLQAGPPWLMKQRRFTKRLGSGYESIESV